MNTPPDTSDASRDAFVLECTQRYRELVPHLLPHQRRLIEADIALAYASGYVAGLTTAKGMFPRDH